MFGGKDVHKHVQTISCKDKYAHVRKYTNALLHLCVLYLKKGLPGNPSGTRKDLSTPISFEFKTLHFLKL